MNQDCSMSVTLVEITVKNGESRPLLPSSADLSRPYATSESRGPTFGCLDREINPQPNGSTSNGDHQLRDSPLPPIRRRQRSIHRPNANRRVPTYHHERPRRTLNTSVFDRLVEENFVQINLQDEMLALGSCLKQFEENKFQEVIQAVRIYYTPNPQAFRPDMKLTMDRIQSRTEKWINSLKLLSSFQNICVADQILCIKSRFVDLCIVTSLGFINPTTRSIQKGEMTIRMERCPMMNDPNFLNLLYTMNPIFRFDPNVNMLLVLIYLFDANTPELRSSLAIRKERIITLYLLKKYLESIGFSDDQANHEIVTTFNQLNRFLALFNGKQRILDALKSTIINKSRLLSEILDLINTM